MSAAPKGVAGGLSAKKLRERIVSHGGSKPTPTGPEYVPCQCDRCKRDRAALTGASA